MELNVNNFNEWIHCGFYVFYVIAILEILVLKKFKPAHFDWKEFFITALTVFISRYIGFILPFNLAGPIMKYAWQNPIGEISLDTPFNFLLLFLLIEFIFYWTHRIGHRVRFWWLTHSVHHSPTTYNYATSLLNGLTGKLIGNGILFSALIWIGFDGKAVIVILFGIDLYQTAIHTTWIGKLGFLEKLLMTPSLHRVHHASNQQYLDCNFGGSLCIFDRIFGTCIEEKSDVQIRYGLVNQQEFPGFIRLHLSPFLYFARDLLSSKSFSDVLAIFISPPSVTENKRPITMYGLSLAQINSQAKLLIGGIFRLDISKKANSDF